MAKTLRRLLLSLPGRITCTARRVALHPPIGWPRRTAFEDTLTRLRTLPAIA